MKLFFALIAVLISPFAAQAADMELPSGWRALKLSELKDTADFTFRSSEKDFLSVMADFDGDGIIDAAQFLVKKDQSEYAFFITTHDRGKVIFHKHYKTKKLQDIARLGIDLTRPGDYDTACGKGYWDCSAKEPPKITLLNPSIHYFVFESASSLIYWDSKRKKFAEIATSD